MAGRGQGIEVLLTGGGGWHRDVDGWGEGGHDARVAVGSNGCNRRASIRADGGKGVVGRKGDDGGQS